MFTSELLAEHKSFPIKVRQFEKGALEAAAKKGITVIIDVFRASNTILALLECGAKRVVPIQHIENLKDYPGFIKVGEESGKKSRIFDHDNSPIEIEDNCEQIKNQNVVIRTTNGTRGLVNAVGSEQILVGSLRNLTAIVHYLIPYAKEGVAISFVAMGSKDLSRIEDVYCAKIMYYQLLSKIDNSKEFRNEFASQENPLNRHWIREIIDERVENDYKREDRLYSLEIDLSFEVPIYDPIGNSITLFKK